MEMMVADLCKRLEAHCICLSPLPTSLKQRLYSLYMAKGTLMRLHIGEFITLIVDLKIVEAKVEV